MFTAKINAVINNYLKYNHTKLAIGIVYKDKPYFFSFSNKKEDEEVKNELYDIGSISKVFTSLLMLKEIEEGKASLEDNIKQYLSLKEGRYWTIESLLSHRCDFTHVTPYQFVVKSLLRSGYSRRNIYEGVDEQALIKQTIKRRKHVNKHRYGYSDFSTAIIALVLEKINNMPFNKQMNDFLKEDLKLSSTTCIKNDLPNRVESFLLNKKIRRWQWDDNNPYIASGGIASSIQDMTLFIKQLIERKDDSYIKAAFSTKEDDKEHNLAFFLSKRKTSYWHVGGIGTFRSSMIVNPNRQTGVIVLGNQIGRRKGNTHYLAKMLYTHLRRHLLKFGE